MQACGARANSMQTVAAAGNSFLSSHRCYKGTALNKTMLLQDLLYFFFFFLGTPRLQGPGLIPCSSCVTRSTHPTSRNR